MSDQESTSRETGLETRHGTHLAAVVTAMVFPTVAAGLYFIILAGHPAMKVGYGAAKVVQLAFPLIWVLWVQQRRLSWSKPTGKGIGIGLAVAVAAAITGLLVYHGLLKDSSLISRMPGLIGAKTREMGLDSPGRYLAFSLFLSFPHALLEEYYWRWFIFGELRRVTTVRTAIVLSSLAFMSHHVIIVHAFIGDPLWLIVLLSLSVAVAGGFWAWLYQRCGSLVAPWLGHVVIDAGIMLIGYDVLFG
ncbi:MAG: CPBP family intramembrane glutamic endopeptidase [Planctomycetaceae bacterium]